MQPMNIIIACLSTVPLHLSEPKKHMTTEGATKDMVQDVPKGALHVSAKANSPRSVKEWRVTKGQSLKVLKGSKLKRKQSYQQIKALKVKEPGKEECGYLLLIGVPDLGILPMQVCFCCRQSSHTMANCPQVGEFKCFRCGERDHTTQQCTQQSDRGVCVCVLGLTGCSEAKKVTSLLFMVRVCTAFAFATCFICNETGHIARMCPDNPRGIYPKGN